MQAIYDGPDGKAWYDSRIQLYGWVTESGNISTSKNTGPSQVSNYPEVYDERGNHVENDQDVLYIERMADENQTDHVDWGFRVALLYGLDYRFMASKGYINDQNLFYKNKYSGFDTPMTYINVYPPITPRASRSSSGASYRCPTSSSNSRRTTSWPATRSCTVLTTTPRGGSGPARS